MSSARARGITEMLCYVTNASRAGARGIGSLEHAALKLRVPKGAVRAERTHQASKQSKSPRAIQYPQAKNTHRLEGPKVRYKLLKFAKRAALKPVPKGPSRASPVASQPPPCLSGICMQKVQEREF